MPFNLFSYKLISQVLMSSSSINESDFYTNAMFYGRQSLTSDDVKTGTNEKTRITWIKVGNNNKNRVHDY